MTDLPATCALIEAHGHMVDDGQKIEQHPASDSIDPTTETLVNDLQARLQDIALKHASEAASWRAKEAEFTTSSINARKALEELKSELAAAQKRLSAAEVQSAQALTAAPAPSTPPPPVNGPGKRRQRSASTTECAPSATVSGTPIRVTRSVHRRITQEALEPSAYTPSFQAMAKFYRFWRQDMPDDLAGLKNSLEIHVRILWCLLDAEAVPKDPPPRLLNGFASRFSTEAQLYSSLESGPELIPLSSVYIGSSMSCYRSDISMYARIMGEELVTYIRVRLAKLGLDRWCPNLRQPPTTLYNTACSIIALETFKQALVSNTYGYLGVEAHHTQYMDLLTRLLNGFVYDSMYLRYNESNAAMADPILSAILMARKRLAKDRLIFLEENGYPQRYCDLIDEMATSDDEFEPGSNIWLIKRRPERSAKVERFFRILDIKRQEYCQQQKSRKRRERTRIVPVTGQSTSSLKVLPDHMPIDYFDPAFLNQLQPMIRKLVAVPMISLLPNVEDSFSWCPDERLHDETFTRKYGQAVLDRYNLFESSDGSFDKSFEEGTSRSNISTALLS